MVDECLVDEQTIESRNRDAFVGETRHQFFRQPYVSAEDMFDTMVGPHEDLFIDEVLIDYFMQVVPHYSVNFLRISVRKSPLVERRKEIEFVPYRCRIFRIENAARRKIFQLKRYPRADLFSVGKRPQVLDGKFSRNVRPEFIGKNDARRNFLSLLLKRDLLRSFTFLKRFLPFLIKIYQTLAVFFDTLF